MKWFELIFSDQPRLRYRRHIIFWITWWIYFAGSYFFTQQGFEQAGSAKWISIILSKSLLLLLCHVFIVYISIYLLLPRFIKKEKWISFSGILITTIAITVAWGYFCYAVLFPVLEELFQLPGAIKKNVLLWNSISASFISSLKVVIAAVAIKLIKYWWLKQKETERLEKEKIAVELQLLKAQIHPDLLFSSLENIYQFAQYHPSKASELLLKLSDLLSYVLYECDQPEVSLEKELKMVKNYIALQKIQMSNQLEVSIALKGDTDDKMIAPLLLLPFLENSLSYCNHQSLEKSWISLEIKIEDDELFIKLINGKCADHELPVAPYENGLGNVYKRLLALYPGKNEFRMHAEPEVMMTYLKINLVPEQPYSEAIDLANIGALA
jgi:sensor histidine kinase YesM